MPSLLKRAGCSCLIGAILLLHGAIGTAGSQPGHPVPQRPYQNAYNESYGADPARSPRIADQAQHSPYAAKYENACDEPETPEEADLCQQWRMAKASEELVDLADRQFLATIAEVFFLIVTAGCTAWAAYAAAKAAIASHTNTVAAQKMADAATEANRLNREHFIEQSRARLELIGNQIVSDLKWENDCGSLTCKITVRNAGHTNASGVWFCYDTHTDKRSIDTQEIMRRYNALSKQTRAEALESGGFFQSIEREKTWSAAFLVAIETPDDPDAAVVPEVFCCVDYGLFIYKDERCQLGGTFMIQCTYRDSATGQTHTGPIRRSLGDIPSSRLALVLRKLIAD